MVGKNGNGKTEKNLKEKLLGAIAAAVVSAILTYIETRFDEELWEKGKQI